MVVFSRLLPTRGAKEPRAAEKMPLGQRIVLKIKELFSQGPDGGEDVTAVIFRLGTERFCYLAQDPGAHRMTHVLFLLEGLNLTSMECNT